MSISLAKKLGIYCLGLVILASCQQVKKVEEQASQHVSLIENDSLKRIDVFVDGAYFTSYLYADTILRKPVLFPLMTASGARVTRGYPFAPNAGERIDHPHHYGLWFNHGDVNGVDYWNSSIERKKDDPRYGRIDHVRFVKKVSGETGVLEVEKEWHSTGALVLKERTRYTFDGDPKNRTITHSTTLTALEADVLFEDSKEGMFALRVRRELEIPSEDSTMLLNDSLLPAAAEVVNTTGVSGHYLNSEGLEGYPDVWGKRAKWMRLAGVVNGDSISVCIFDHPSNVNHPPHWMARDYGLFGVNPLGSKLYTDGMEEFNFKLKKGDSVTFKHQIVIRSGGPLTTNDIGKLYNDFATGGASGD
ncbi:MAG TPA: PmoA family protein [Chryseolinea sp.]